MNPSQSQPPNHIQKVWHGIPAILSGIASIVFVFFLWYEKSVFLFKENSIYIPQKKIYSKHLPSPWVPQKELPKSLSILVVKNLDKQFFYHNGYLPSQLFWKFLEQAQVIRTKPIPLTITQRLIEELFPHVQKTNSFSGYLEKTILAVALEKNMQKKEILEYYINLAKYGKGIRGIHSASYYYFEKSPKDLSDQETHQLIQYSLKAYSKE